MLEAKDPYTSGHQLRSKIAVNIARILGLRGDKITGILWSGIIHDIGKVKVPAELLSRPGKLKE